MLLRHVPVLAADDKPQPAITPSQVAKLLAAEETVNLEVEVRGFDDKPLGGIVFHSSDGRDMAQEDETVGG